VNLKLCQVMRVPADFVDVEQDSDQEVETDDESAMLAAALADDGLGDTTSEYDDEESSGDDIEQLVREQL